MRTRKFTIVFGVILALVLTSIMTGEPQRASAYGGADQFRAWIVSGPSVMNTNTTGTYCSVSAKVGVREFGKHGVTKFKIKYELRTSNDVKGILPYAKNSGYRYSPEFPNDSESYYVFDALPSSSMIYDAGKDYHLWVKFVGVRGWRADFTRHFDLGAVGCEIEIREDTGFAEGVS